MMCVCVCPCVVNMTPSSTLAFTLSCAWWWSMSVQNAKLSVYVGLLAYVLARKWLKMTLKSSENLLYYTLTNIQYRSTLKRWMHKINNKISIRMYFPHTYEIYKFAFFAIQMIEKCMVILFGRLCSEMLLHLFTQSASQLIFKSFRE